VKRNEHRIGMMISCMAQVPFGPVVAGKIEKPGKAPQQAGCERIGQKKGQTCPQQTRRYLVIAEEAEAPDNRLTVHSVTRALHRLL
jgi:hypothetical protein